ncbi:cytochrome C [Elizabethkingia anophelis]|nr:cytochrome C [Elizabethkingia anophelis]
MKKNSIYPCIGIISCNLLFQKKKQKRSSRKPNLMLCWKNLKQLRNLQLRELRKKKEKKLVEGADCLSCHKVDAKLVGPSYQDVAAKYTDADIDHLAGKIIEGGKGVWGDIPMTPHAGLSQDNAKLMVRYILSLKK